MPLREPISFSPLAVTAMTTSSGHASLSSSGSAKLSLPSGDDPACISTNPPKIERAADPEPWRATMLRSRALSVRPNAASAARTSAAYPDAEDASPAAVGKLLRLVTRTRVSTPALLRRRSTHAESFSRSSSRRLPSRTSSSPRSLGTSSTSVSVNNASSVIEIEPTAGTFKRASALPQYLTSAKFAPARAAARPCCSEIVIRLEPVDGLRYAQLGIAPSILQLPLRLATRKIHVLRRHPHAVERDARLALRQRRQRFGRDCERIDRPMRQANRTRSPADMLRDDAEDPLQREVVSAQDVALAGHAELRGREMTGRHVVDVHEIQARVDERGHAPRRGVEQDAARRRRLDVARADRRRRIDRDDGKLDFRTALADGLLGQELRALVVPDHVFDRHGRVLVGRRSVLVDAEHGDTRRVDQAL